MPNVGKKANGRQMASIRRPYGVRMDVKWPGIQKKEAKWLVNG